MRKIKVGIIGCGRIAWQWDRPGAPTYNTHAKAYAADPRVHLVACADARFDKAKGLACRYKGVKPYRNYKEMLKKESLDIVSVCTLPENHFEVVRHILVDTPISYIFVEKPLTTSLTPTCTLAQLAHRRRAYIMINYPRRFDCTIQNIRNIIIPHRLGKLCFGRMIYYDSLKNNAIHLLDLLEYFGFSVGSPQQIGRFRKLGTDWQGSFLVKTDYGAPVAFQWFEEKQYGYLEVDLFFEQGRIRLGDYSDAEVFKASDSKDCPGYRDLQLVKYYPSTFMTVVKYAVNHLVQYFQGRKVDYKFLDREVSLMKLIQRITRQRS